MIDARSPAPAAPNTLCYVPGNVDQKDKNPVSAPLRRNLLGLH